MALAKAYYGSRTEITADYTATEADTLVAVVGLALALTVTLPDPATFPLDETFTVKDETGLASSTLTVTIVDPVGPIEGATQQIASAFGKFTFYTSGKKWFIAESVSGAIQAATVNNTTTTEVTTVLGVYQDVLTPGPQVSVVTGTSAIVWICNTSTLNAGIENIFVSFEVSGATTIAASDVNAIASIQQVYIPSSNMRAVLITGLNPGLNTFKMKYKSVGNNSDFERRVIAVFPL